MLNKQMGATSLRTPGYVWLCSTRFITNSWKLTCLLTENSMFDWLMKRTRWRITSTNYQKNSFFHRTVPDWNCLPEDTVCSSTPSFRVRISPWNTSTVWYPWGVRDCRQLLWLWHCNCWLKTFYTSHCQLLNMVWSPQ